jgi:hypothetical protein
MSTFSGNLPTKAHITVTAITTTIATVDSHTIGDVIFIILSSCSGDANLSRAAFLKILDIVTNS